MLVTSAGVDALNLRDVDTVTVPPAFVSAAEVIRVDFTDAGFADRIIAARRSVLATAVARCRRIGRSDRGRRCNRVLRS